MRELGIGGRHLSRLGRRLFDIIHKLHKIDLYIFIYFFFESKNNNKQLSTTLHRDSNNGFILFLFSSTNSLKLCSHHITRRSEARFYIIIYSTTWLNDHYMQKNRLQPSCNIIMGDNFLLHDINSYALAVFVSYLNRISRFKHLHCENW